MAGERGRPAAAAATAGHCPAAAGPPPLPDKRRASRPVRAPVLPSPPSLYQVELAPHYYSKKEIMEQAAKKLPKTLGKAAES